MTTSTLHELLTGIVSKKIRVVDLTNTLHNETPVLQLPPQWNLH